MPQNPNNAKAESLLSSLGFTKFLPPSRVMSALKKEKSSARSGIYVHSFGRSGQFYVGRAKDITARYVQHTRNYTDISHTSIKLCHESDMSVSEKETIDAMKKLFPLRNKLADWFDLCADEIEKLRSELSGDVWLKDDTAVYTGKQKFSDQGQMDRYKSAFEKAMSSDYFNEGEAAGVFARYIRTCIPQPASTETLFWTIGCMTKGLYTDHPKLVAMVRLNVAKPEVMTAIIDEHYGKKGPRLVYMMRVAADSIDSKEFKRLMALGADHLHDVHKPTGQKLHKFFVQSPAVVHAFLDSAQFRRAAKLHNLTLMRYSATYGSMADCHCLPMSTHLWSVPLRKLKLS